MNTLRALKRSPLGLDLYLWLVYRTFSLKTPLCLSWRQLFKQFGADPAKAGDRNTVNDFRTKSLRELKKIKRAWPDLRYAHGHGRARDLSPRRHASRRHNSGSSNRPSAPRDYPVKGVRPWGWPVSGPGRLTFVAPVASSVARA